MLPGTTGGVTAVSRTLSMEGCMELSLSRKITCITGGSRGIGFATARTFAAEGARVIVCGRGRERLDAAVDRIKKETGVDVEAIVADVTKPDDIDRLIGQIAAKYGHLDVLVNNAGTGIYKAFADVTEEDLAAGMSINFFAQFRVTQRALPLLKKSAGASIVNVSGRTALRGNFPPGSSCTGPAKAAEVRFSIDLATELAETGIRVNCVVPGVVETEDRFRLWEGEALSTAADDTSADQIRRKLETSSVPSKTGWGKPEQIADVIAFLASARASYVNGVALTVDGGPHNKSYITELYGKRAAVAGSSAAV
jgi:3-oxoacyl-[acyl-carrier protein] reductase